MHNRYCCEKLKKMFHFEDLEVERETILNFWRRNYFFLILAHPVYKM